MTKHTPSPWFAVKNSADFYDIKIEDDTYAESAGCGCMVWGEANAHLVAAAPDMLREMKKLAKALEDVAEVPQSFYDAIKKSEGN